MTRLVRHGICAMLALVGLQAAPAATLTEARIRAAVTDDIPEEAQFKAWPGVPDRTLIAWTDDESTSSDEAAVDLTVLVVQTSTARVLQRYHEDKAWNSESVQFESLEFDTANYTLAPGSRAFGVRLFGRHLGFAAEESQTLRLLEPAGAALNKVLTLQTMSNLATRDCGEGHDMTRTVAVAPTLTRGHADLVVHERRQDTPDGSNAPTRCHPRVRHSERTTTLRFDGTRYPGVGN
jgi:hypothetical protein